MGATSKKKIYSKNKSDLILTISSWASVACIFSGLFFLSPNITGNAIADLSSNATFFMGASLLNIGLFAGFFYFHYKHKIA